MHIVRSVQGNAGSHVPPTADALLIVPNRHRGS